MFKFKIPTIPKDTRGMAIAIIIVVVLIIGLLGVVMHQSLQRSSAALGAARFDTLMKELDTAMASIKEQSTVDNVVSIVKKADETKERVVEISGILWSEDDPLAIIDDKIVRVGESILGCWVMGIEKNRVAIRCMDGEQKEFKLFEEK